MSKLVGAMANTEVLRCLPAIGRAEPATAPNAEQGRSAVFRWSGGRKLRLDDLVDYAAKAHTMAKGNGPKHHRTLATLTLRETV